MQKKPLSNHLSKIILAFKDDGFLFFFTFLFYLLLLTSDKFSKSYTLVAIEKSSFIKMPAGFLKHKRSSRESKNFFEWLTLAACYLFNVCKLIFYNFYLHLSSNMQSCCISGEIYRPKNKVQI